MHKDQRLYGKLTLDFPDHPKIAILSDAAFRCLVEATLWSRQQQTDGWLARRYAVARWSLDVLQELCQNDDEKPSLTESEKGWLIRDYAEHQDTKAEIEERRERNRLAGQKGGLAKAKRSAKRPASKSVSENVAEKEKEKHPEVTTNVVTSGTRKRGSRLQFGWEPPREVIEAMRAECPHVDLRYEHRQFVDYWTDKSGANATKVSWVGTWRNWMRRAAAQQQERTAPPSNVTAFERKKAANAAVFQSLGESHLPELS